MDCHEILETFMSSRLPTIAAFLCTLFVTLIKNILAVSGQLFACDLQISLGQLSDMHKMLNKSRDWSAVKGDIYNLFSAVAAIIMISVGVTLHKVTHY